MTTSNLVCRGHLKLNTQSSLASLISPLPIEHLATVTCVRLSIFILVEC